MDAPQMIWGAFSCFFGNLAIHLPPDARDIGALLGSNVVTVASSRLRMQKNRAWLARPFFQIHQKNKTNMTTLNHDYTKPAEAELLLY